MTEIIAAMDDPSFILLTNLLILESLHTTAIRKTVDVGITTILPQQELKGCFFGYQKADTSVSLGQREDPLPQFNLMAAI